jgi:penicillin amidase
VLKIASLLTCLVVFLVVALAVWQGDRALPLMDGTLCLPELNGVVEVYFDQLAVPYIQAGCESDLCLAQGFITAGERMFQMDILRRTAEGELSEVFGSSSLPHDRLMRTIGFNRLANIELGTLSVEARKNLSAYCAGVNAYLSRSTKRYPLEFLALGYKPRKWQIQDTLAILKYLQYQLDESWRLDELRSQITNRFGARLADKMFALAKAPVPTMQKLESTTINNIAPYLVSTRFTGVGTGGSVGADVGVGCTAGITLNAGARYASRTDSIGKYLWGSNGWAVGRAISSSKGGMLACSKDSVFSFPDIWYLCSLQTSSFHAAGGTIPGIPGVLFGRNEKIGWAINSLKADVQDLFVEQFSAKNPDKYKVPGGWCSTFVIKEEIPVRFSGNSIENIDITRHGPLLIKDKDKGVALSWTGLQVGKSIFETIWQLDKANNWAEFKSALRNYNGSPQNFLYADRQGNIGSQVAGNIPVRKSDRKSEGYLYTSGARVLPGWLDDSFWSERLNFDELYSSYNNFEGFVIANDKRFARVNTTSNGNGPRRLLTLLAQHKQTGQALDLGDMSVLQSDQMAPLRELIINELGQSLTRTNCLDTYSQQSLQLLRSWDGQLRADSAAAALYESFIITLIRRVLEPKIGSELTCQYVESWPEWTSFVAKVIQEKPADLLPMGERNYETFLLTTFSQSLKNVRVSLQTDESNNWKWQNLHPLNFLSSAQENLPKFVLGLSSIFLPSPANSKGIGGDQDSVNAAGTAISQAPWAYASASGSSNHMLMDMSDQDKFYQTLSLGQSGHLFSKHNCDQLAAWLSNNTHPIAFSSKQLRSQARHLLVLKNYEEPREAGAPGR